MKRCTLAVALLAFGATPSFADNDSGLYLGLGVGQFNVKIDDVSDVTTTVENFDSDDTTYKAFVGWRFMPYLAVELAYLDLGKPEDTIENVKVETEISGIAPYVIGTLPLGPVELFAKVGYYFYDVKVNGQSLVSVDDSNEDLLYGAGVGITLFEHLHARLEYEVIDISDVGNSNVADSDALWLSGAWRF